MHKLSNKAQFFILTAVMVVGVFFTLSKYVNQYSFIDSSKAADGAEIFMFENIKEKAVKTVEISNRTNVDSRLTTYKTFVEEMAAERGYALTLEYRFDTMPNPNFANINMTMRSEKYTIKADFSVPVPPS